MKQQMNSNFNSTKHELNNLNNRWKKHKETQNTN